MSANLSNLREEFDEYLADYYCIGGADQWEVKQNVDERVNKLNNVELLDILCGVIQRLGDV